VGTFTIFAYGRASRDTARGGFSGRASPSFLTIGHAGASPLPDYWPLSLVLDAALVGHDHAPGQHTVGVAGPPRAGIPLVAAEEVSTARPVLVPEAVPLLSLTRGGMASLILVLS
jgi:hypothetical protein